MSTKKLIYFNKKAKTFRCFPVKANLCYQNIATHYKHIVLNLLNKKEAAQYGFKNTFYYSGKLG